VTKTFTKVDETKRGAFGDMTAVFGRLDITSYTSGGEDFALSDVPGLSSTVTTVLFGGVSDQGFVFHYDESNDQVKAFAQDGSGTSGSDTVGLAEADGSDDAGEAWCIVIGK
jgi:hypothetical protein